MLTLVCRYIDVFGPISNGQLDAPEPTQDYGHNIASHAEREAP